MTSKPPSLTIAIPAWNEESSIEQTILSVLAASRDVPDVDLEILVVDDGSTDRTAKIVEALCRENAAIRMVQNGTNQGVGMSIRRAIAEARCEKIAIVPGDNDLPLAMLRQMVKNSGSAQIVMYYFLNGEIRGRFRYLLSNLFMMIYATTFNLYVQYINGPAVYPVDILRTVRLRSTQFSIMTEMNVKLLRQGVTFAEFPSVRIGVEKTGSLSLKSFFETVRVFFEVIFDVYVWERKFYDKQPVRVFSLD
jgi:glycosyltransferase involved in cell wall biosynthesis